MSHNFLQEPPVIVSNYAVRRSDTMAVVKLSEPTSGKDVDLAKQALLIYLADMRQRYERQSLPYVSESTK